VTRREHAFEPGGPDVMIDPRTHWCDRHREPFRAAWPKGYMPASMALLEEAVRREDVLRAAGWEPETGAVADTAKLSPVLAEYGPLCCLVGDETTAKWTELALADDLGPMKLALEELRARPAP
jgi:hypothetical protein